MNPLRHLFPLVMLICLSIPLQARSAVFYLPENGDTMIGQIQHVQARKSDTLSEIAQRFDLGYNEIISANPDVDPWLPAEGAPILIPTRYILPPKPWRGIVINLAEMRLYYFPEQKNSISKPLVYSFPIGIGRESWATPVGKFQITEKIKNPVWTVPNSVLAEAASEGRSMPWQLPAGEDNPLGDYAMLLDEPGYMIHGTNKSAGVGRRVSHGCIRLYPEDIEQLIAQVPRNTEVRIIDQPLAYGFAGDVLYVESNRDRDISTESNVSQTEYGLANLHKVKISLTRRESARVNAIAKQAFSLPVPVKALEVKKPQVTYSLIVPKPEALTRRTTPAPVYSPMVLVKLFGRQQTQTDTMENGVGKVKQICELTSCYQYGPYTSQKLAFAYSEILKHGYGMGSYIVDYITQ